MDFVDELLFPKSEMDRLAETNRLEDRSWVRELVALRQARGMSREDVAEIMGVSVSGVERIESAPHDLSLSSLLRYSLAVKARVHHTVTRSEDEQYVVTYPFPVVEDFEEDGEDAEHNVMVSRWAVEGSESAAVFDE